MPESPISAAYRLLDESVARRAGDVPVLDLSQAAPAYPPPPEVTAHLCEVIDHPRLARYGDIAGLDRLRQVVADELSADYAGDVRPEQVLVTAGCNQAFCVTMGALCAPGDEVVLASPYYFNHDMWLRLNHIRPVYLPADQRWLQDPETLLPLLGERTRAICLVSPGNPTGAVLPPETIAAFAAVAADHNVALVLDETYRGFRDTSEPAHHLFADTGWSDVLVSLHSFSKELAIPGHRVGAVVADERLLDHMAKLLDCLAIHAPIAGQEAAWAGLTRSRTWRSARQRESAERREQFSRAMADDPGGFRLESTGAFFAWVRHPFPDCPTTSVVRRLVEQCGLLTLPGTAFMPEDEGMLRLSVGNLDAELVEHVAIALRGLG